MNSLRSWCSYGQT